MVRRCEICETTYDDAVTYCPHDRFLSAEDLAQKDAGLALLGKVVRFAHEPENAIARRVQCVCWNGMVEIEGMTGEFAPHLFVVCG